MRKPGIAQLEIQERVDFSNDGINGDSKNPAKSIKDLQKSAVTLSPVIATKH